MWETCFHYSQSNHRDDFRSFHYPITGVQWERCSKFGSTRVCPDVRMRFEDFESSCIGSLFKARSVGKLGEACRMRVRKAHVSEARELAPGRVLVRTGGDAVVFAMRCNGFENSTLIKGSYVTSLPTGCSLSGMGWTYKSPPQEIDQRARLHVMPSASDIPSAVLGADNWLTMQHALNTTVAGRWMETTEAADRIAAERVELLTRSLDKKSDGNTATVLFVLGACIGFEVVLAALLAFVVISVRRLEHRVRPSEVEPSQEPVVVFDGAQVVIRDEEERGRRRQRQRKSVSDVTLSEAALVSVHPLQT